MTWYGLKNQLTHSSENLLCALIWYLLLCWIWLLTLAFTLHVTAQKMQFSIKDSLRKFDQIRSFQPIWSHLLKKSLMHNFIFCAVFHLNCHHQMILAKTYSFTQKNVWHQNLTNNGIIRNNSERFDSKKTYSNSCAFLESHQFDWNNF